VCIKWWCQKGHHSGEFDKCLEKYWVFKCPRYLYLFYHLSCSVKHHQRIMSLLLQIGLGLCALIIVILARPWLHSKSKSPHPLPPGPRGDIIIGHVRHIPASRPELTYIKWGKDYSKHNQCRNNRYHTNVNVSQNQTSCISTCSGSL